MTTDEWDDQAKRDWLRWELDSTRDEWERDQAQHVMPEHTPAIASQVVADARIPFESTRVKGRGVRYATGIVAPDGYAETVGTVLCWRCDREAEYGGYCEQHWDDRQEEVAEQEMLEHDEWVEDAYSREELERAMREEEERRDDH